MPGKRMTDGWSVKKKREIWDALATDPDILPPAPENIALVSLSETIEDAKARQELKALNGGVLGLRTGWPSVDNITLGLAPGELTVVFGDTGHGKSTFCQNLAYNVAMRGTTVLFIGLEMDNIENTGRFLDIAEAEEQAFMLPIIYPEKNDIRLETVEQVVSEAKRNGAELAVIDHLQWLARSVENTTSELSMITHTIKRIAVANQISVILVSHINRQGAGLDFPPSLQHLKGSGSIEQDADKCIAIWRDRGDSFEGSLQVVGRKNRRGPDASAVLQVEGVKMKEVPNVVVLRR